MTLLTAVQAVGSHPAVSGIDGTVTTVLANSDLKPIVALFQQEANELRSRHDWSGLQTIASFTLQVPTNSVFTASLPVDFRRFVPDTSLFHVEWRRACIGPVDSVEWQGLTLYAVPNSTTYWRRLGSNILFVGAATGDTISYEYISAYPVVSSAGTPQAGFLADTDVLRVPEELAVLGVIWRWRASKGLDYSQERASYEQELLNAIADDRGTVGTLSLRRGRLTDETPLPFIITT